MRIHAIQTGRLLGNETFLRGDGWSSLLRRRADVEFPAHAFIIEHPEGTLAIDTGLRTGIRVPRPLLRFAPRPLVEPEELLVPRMRAQGLEPEEVRRVVLTHLDWDHVGGIGQLPHAEAVVHRPEREFASTLPGRLRFDAKNWPSSFEPTLYDLDPEPYGPFSKSRALTEAGDVRVVPLPGHTPGQVGVVIEADDVRLFFCADHVLNQRWLVEDLAAGKLLGLGIWSREQAEETTKRLAEFVRERPTVLLPSHDADAPRRLEAREPLRL